jgi:PAS domain-containing protein
MGHPTSLPERDPEVRVRETVDLLRALWGEELPPAPQPWRTALLDAVVADDEHGTRRGLVVQGDGLTHIALAALVRSAGPGAPALPPGLARLLRDVPTVTSRPEPDPALRVPTDVGLWTYDLPSRTVMFDEACGLLLGEGSVAIGDRPVSEALTTTIHPDDQERVAEALDAADASRPGYDVGFRTHQPDGSWLALRGRGRVIAAGSQGPRLVGVLFPEQPVS